MCLVNRSPNISNTNFMTIYGCMASSQVLTHLWVFHNHEGLKCTFKKTAYCRGSGWIGTSTEQSMVDPCAKSCPFWLSTPCKSCLFLVETPTLNVQVVSSGEENREIVRVSAHCTCMTKYASAYISRPLVLVITLQP